MEGPQIAAKKSAKIDVEPGTYYWCACGRSSKQPFCDNSHQGTDFTPIKVEFNEKKTVSFCQCKYSAKKPLCDGTHRDL